MPITVTPFDHTLELVGNADIDLGADSFKLALMTPSFVLDVTDTTWAAISADEIAAGNGYTAAGQVLDSVTFTEASGIVKFDAADEQFLAAGGTMATFQFGIIYDDTHVGDTPLFSIDLDASIILADTDDFTFQWNATNGIFRMGLGSIA